MTDPIDVVIPWVDGNDPDHIKKRLSYIDRRSKSWSAGTRKERFEQSNEIFYCINSILKFMPWVRNIYLITDAQTPSFLAKEATTYKKVLVIDHNDIFEGYEEALPTFNTRSISSCYWRIPNLSEYFIYFNDDMIVQKELAKSDFVLDDKVIAHGKWIQAKNYRTNKALRHMVNMWRYYASQPPLSDRSAVAQKTAKAIGFKERFFLQHHLPYTLRKENFLVFFNQYESLKTQISYRFRDLSQYLPESISTHLDIMNGRAICVSGSEFHTYITPENIRSDINIKTLLSNPKSHFLCLQSFEKYKKNQKDIIYEYLNSLVSRS